MGYWKLPYVFEILSPKISIGWALDRIFDE